MNMAHFDAELSIYIYELVSALAHWTLSTDWIEAKLYFRSTLSGSAFVRQQIHCKQMSEKYAVSPRVALGPMADTRKAAHVDVQSHSRSMPPTMTSDQHIQEAIAYVPRTSDSMWLICLCKQSAIDCTRTRHTTAPATAALGVFNAHQLFVSICTENLLIKCQLVRIRFPTIFIS